MQEMRLGCRCAMLLVLHRICKSICRLGCCLESVVVAYEDKWPFSLYQAGDNVESLGEHPLTVAVDWERNVCKALGKACKPDHFGKPQLLLLILLFQATSINLRVPLGPHCMAEAYFSHY